MPNENLDPRELLSLVEGEILGDRVADAPISQDKIRELAARIRTNADDQAEYEHLKISVNALRSLPRVDAPGSVWANLEAHYDETWVKGRTTKRPRGLVVRLRRIALNRTANRIVAAAACLLVVVIAGILSYNRFMTPRSPASKNKILFVKRNPLPPQVTAKLTPHVIVGEFLTKVTKRYQGVSPKALRELLENPRDGQLK